MIFGVTLKMHFNECAIMDGPIHAAKVDLLENQNTLLSG
jgi:hypothetical protein